MTPVTASVKLVLAFGDGAADDRSLAGFQPSDAEHFGVRTQIFIGTTDDDLSDSFDVLVCSPSWAAAEASGAGWRLLRAGSLSAMPDSVAAGAGVWFMRRWDMNVFLDAVAAVCASASPGPDWGTVASRIGRLIPWEFAYRYDAHVDQRYGVPFPP